MRKILGVALVAMCLCLSFILVACSAPASAQGKYTNTNASVEDSYIDVISENTCNLKNVWVSQLHEFVSGENKTFDVSKDGKTVYLAYTESLSLTASFNLQKQTISYCNYDYKK